LIPWLEYKAIGREFDWIFGSQAFWTINGAQGSRVVHLGERVSTKIRLYQKQAKERMRTFYCAMRMGTAPLTRSCGIGIPDFS
jgi:hypothetical protein